MKDASQQSKNEPPVYLDNAAATPPRPAFLHAWPRLATDAFYNPHATNGFSEDCMRRLQNVERQLLAALHIPETEADVIWTSGGTEANNLAILGVMEAFGDGAVAVEAAAHSSLLEPAEHLQQAGFEYCKVPVDDAGKLVLAEGAFCNWSPQSSAVKHGGSLRQGTAGSSHVRGLPTPGCGRGLPVPVADNTSEPANFANLRLFAFCHVNNESGSVQDICEVRRFLDANASSSLLLVDALQSFTKLDIAWGEGGIDLLSVGGRKLGGPPEIGALIVRRGVPLKPLFFGGAQQRGLRPGTLSPASILAFSVAVDAALAEREGEWARVKQMNQSLRARLLAEFACESPVLLSPDDASPYILSVAFPKYEGAILMRKLSRRGVVVGTGSACSAESAGTSHVLDAMGVNARLARGVLRVSFGHANQETDVDVFLRELRHVMDDY
jgi:cysteine desulfurase